MASAIPATPTCAVCTEVPELTVINTADGSYVGTRCACGPITRYSEYYAKPMSAWKALASDNFGTGLRVRATFKR